MQDRTSAIELIILGPALPHDVQNRYIESSLYQMISIHYPAAVSDFQQNQFSVPLEWAKRLTSCHDDIAKAKYISWNHEIYVPPIGGMICAPWSKKQKHAEGFEDSENHGDIDQVSASVFCKIGWRIRLL